MSTIYLRVKELREAKGWTQVELSERSGVRRPTISAIENEQTKGVDFDVLERLADALGVDPAFLIVRSERARGGQK